MKLAGNTLIVLLVLLATAILAVLGLARYHSATITRDTPPIGRMIEVDGRTVHVIIKGSGPDLVLIHGANGNARDMDLTLGDRLATRYRVIMFDRPGLGYTDQVSPAYARAFATAVETPLEQARLLQTAAAQLGAERPIVLGHSYGAAVALAWAIDRPETLSALVDISGVSNPWPGSLGPLYQIVGSSVGGGLIAPLIAAFVPTSYVESTIGAIFDPNPVPMNYGHDVGAALALRTDAIRANARQVNRLRPEIVKMVEHYPALDLPVEIVHGDADTIVPLTIHSRPLAQQIPNAHLTVLSDVGHMPHHAAPDEVIAAIDRAAARADLP